MLTHKQQWEAVLDEVEADMCRSGQTIAGGADNPERAAAIAAFISPIGPMSLGTSPAQLAAPELPPLATMPPVPPELRERIRGLRNNIIGLQVELAAELHEWRTKHAGLTVTALPITVLPGATPSHFVDRRL